MADPGEYSLMNFQTQQGFFPRISQLICILKYRSETGISNDGVETVTTALHELNAICQKLMQGWNEFCIVPLLYLIEPVFRSLKILIIFPNVHVVIASSQFLSSLMRHRVKLYSTIAVERIFSSIFDVSTVSIMFGTLRRTLQLNASGINQDNQFVAVTSVVGLLSDLLKSGASNQYIGSDFVFVTFDLFLFLLSTLNAEDDRHKDLISKCYSAFPMVLKLRSKADIVVSSFKKRKKCLGEDFTSDILASKMSRNLRLESWAALGSEIYPCLLGTFLEFSNEIVLLCDKIPSSSREHQKYVNHVLFAVAQRRQFVCASKLFVRTSSAVDCVRVVIDALNRWRSHLATGDARSEVEKLQSTWFGTGSSFIVCLLVYCFDSNVVIRNQAVSTLKAIGVFCPSYFSKQESVQLISNALSIIAELCTCPRLITDINWLQELCTSIGGGLPHGLCIPPVRLTNNFETFLPTLLKWF